MTNSNLLNIFHSKEQLAKAGMLSRLRHDPLKYLTSQFFLRIIYPITKRGRPQQIMTFFGNEMEIVLPAGMDLHLLGIKTHDSELRLAKFLIKNLQKGDVFVDLGAHFGYFSLLASKIVGEEGKVLSFDASASTFQLLTKNLAGHQNINCFHMAVSDSMGKKLNFYEFPVLYSEFNSRYTEQYIGESWFGKIKARKIEVDAITMDHFLDQFQYHPTLIKIDIEGGEYDALKGMEKSFSKMKPSIIMEFNTHSAKNTPHWKAYEYLLEYDYAPFIINEEGLELACPDLKEHLNKLPEESDNILFK